MSWTNWSSTGTGPLQVARDDHPATRQAIGDEQRLAILRRLKQSRTDRWRLPGRTAGQHVTADTLPRRLKRYGIDRSLRVKAGSGRNDRKG